MNICVLKYVCDSQICDIQVTVFIEPKKLPKKKTQVIWNKLFSDAIHLVGCLEDQALLSPPGLGNKLPCLCRQHLDLPQKDLYRLHFTWKLFFLFKSFENILRNQIDLHFCYLYIFLKKCIVTCFVITNIMIANKLPNSLTFDDQSYFDTRFINLLILKPLLRSSINFTSWN